SRLQGRANSGGDLVELAIKLGGLLDDVVVHDNAEFMGAIDGVAKALLALVDQLDEALARRPAEDLIRNSDLSRAIELAQPTDDFQQKRRGVFQLLFQIGRRVAQTLECLCSTTFASEDKLVSP